MIYWQDFILDEVCGPLLAEDLIKDANVQVCCGSGRIDGSSIMEDGKGNKAVHIQETGQEQRPARMVGLSNLDSTSPSGMEAGRSNRFNLSQHREEA